MRRNTRERREYLYRKSLEGKQRAQYEQKRRIQKALAEGKPIPTELAARAEALDRQLALDVADADPRQPLSFDSEYARLGVRDPKVFVTTSRHASARLKQFARELQQYVLCASSSADALATISAAQRLNRGSHMLRELVAAARANDATDLVLLHECKGDPTGMVVCHLPYGPTAFFGLFNVVLRHDVELTASGRAAGVPLQTRPHVIADGFTTPLGQRVLTILRALLPPFQPPAASGAVASPDDGKRVVTLANRDDYISFRHHAYTIRRRSKRTADDAQRSAEGGGDDQGSDKDEDGDDESASATTTSEHGRSVVELTEIGPRFELRPFQIVLGTIDSLRTADVEWALSVHTNTAKKRRVL